MKERIYSIKIKFGSQEKLTAAVLKAEVGEPPDVAEPDGVGHTAHGEVVPAAPLAPLHLALCKYTTL